MPSCASWPSAWCVRRKRNARLSRDLHDGISQWLVSIKLQIEAALERLRGTPEQAAAARAGFEKTATQINGVLAEVRRISHDLRPAILDDLGLAAALEHLCGEWREQPADTDRLRARAPARGRRGARTWSTPCCSAWRRKRSPTLHGTPTPARSACACMTATTC
jgi:hypothetical protein